MKEGYTRVTEVIGKFSYVNDIPDEVLQKAADKGTQVHSCIESYLKDEFFFTTPEAKPYVDCFIKWYDRVKDSDIMKGVRIIEERLYDDDLMITGQIDLIIATDEKTYAFDWKTSSNVQQKSWALQGAAYKYLLEKNGYKNVETPIFIKLNKINATEYKYDNFSENFDMFKKCLEVYRYFS